MESNSPIPPINERVGHLRPSKEHLEGYKKKIAHFDGEHGQLLKILEKYKSIIEDQHKLQSDLQQREGEIAELKNALSDMEVYLFQEKEQSLRLHAENDRLKIRELEDRKKIQHLLSLVGADDGETTYFLREPPHKVVIKQKMQQSGENLNLRPTKLKPNVTRKGGFKKGNLTDSETSHILEKYKTHNHTLILQVEALHAQMEEQTRLAREQVDSLQEDRKMKIQEALAERQRFESHIKTLTEKLQRAQNLLYESTKDYLKLKYETKTQEKKWMMERDRLLWDLNGPKKSMSTSMSRQAASGDNTQTDFRQKYKEDMKAMQEEVKQANRLAEMYREQCVKLESELAQAREETEAGQQIFKDRAEKLSERLKLTTQRHEALAKRRTLEVEGFKTDLRQLRQKLKDVEKQLVQVLSNAGPNQDLAMLQEVRESNTRTKKVQSDLMKLKAKIYGLENELRFC
ncbi:coiled-coil domain-containing protein 77 [Syngnathus scovelli]|uniref:coiled-coil domain-containing protein 77 n=1 Tax=Syngnathus scovelli TaxID=161590 RepID=UPI0021108371|nr:coiled-coil domain-containing protein 77 [Syngnathus scovelli]